MTQCKQRHRHQGYLSVFKGVDRNIPEDLDIHMVVGNYSTHKHPKVEGWLAARARWHVHYTPTYAPGGLSRARSFTVYRFACAIDCM